MFYYHKKSEYNIFISLYKKCFEILAEDPPKKKNYIYIYIYIKYCV